MLELLPAPYRHTRTRAVYVAKSPVRMRLPSGEWQDAVLYENDAGELFVQAVAGFLLKFEAV